MMNIDIDDSDKYLRTFMNWICSGPRFNTPGMQSLLMPFFVLGSSLRPKKNRTCSFCGLKCWWFSILQVLPPTRFLVSPHIWYDSVPFYHHKLLFFRMTHPWYSQLTAWTHDFVRTRNWRNAPPTWSTTCCRRSWRVCPSMWKMAWRVVLWRGCSTSCNSWRRRREKMDVDVIEPTTNGGYFMRFHEDISLTMWCLDMGLDWKIPEMMWNADDRK